MLIFLILVVVAVVLYRKIGELRLQNERLAERVADLQLEINAVRHAFLQRINALESRVGVDTGPPPAPATREGQPAPVVAPPPAVEQDEELPPRVEPVISKTPTAPTIPAPPPTPPARSGIEWERLIGVRGAAILSAVVLGLAALLFLQHSIEHGLIPPIVRVSIGLIVGAGAIAASELLRKRGDATTANALAGGGVMVLYASIWAAKSLYDLIGMGLGFALMILTTAACGLLSWRHSAREIAVLGLAGGFVTPLLLSSGQDNPIGLFGYLLLLNATLFALARDRGWPFLGILGVLATTFYQAGWITIRMVPSAPFLV